MPARIGTTMLEDDPYRVPAARIVEAASAPWPPIESAGRWRRFFTFAIDYACYRLASVTLLLMFILLTRRWGIEEVFFGAPDRPRMAFVIVWSYAVIPAYYICMEGLFGTSIGKLAAGTRVVDAQGGKPALRQIVARSFARWIPFEPFSVLFSRDRRGWHDSLAKTWVVRKS